MSNKQSFVPMERIAQGILFIRGKKVMLDSDLAELYGVETRVLVTAVKRNIARFPGDFMFRLDDEEFACLRSQSEISNRRSAGSSPSLKSRPATSDGRGGRRHLPYAFTEQGVAMLSGVLRSPRAVAVNIEIMRAFVRLREVISSNAELAHRLDELERRCGAHDVEISKILEAMRQLMLPPAKKKHPIGFRIDPQPPRGRTSL